MKKSLNSGFILAESLIGFGVLATCVTVFSNADRFTDAKCGIARKSPNAAGAV